MVTRSLFRSLKVMLVALAVCTAMSTSDAQAWFGHHFARYGCGYSGYGYGGYGYGYGGYGYGLGYVSSYGYCGGYSCYPRVYSYSTCYSPCVYSCSPCAYSCSPCGYSCSPCGYGSYGYSVGYGAYYGVQNRVGGAGSYVNHLNRMSPSVQTRSSTAPLSADYANTRVAARRANLVSLAKQSTRKLPADVVITTLQVQVPEDAKVYLAGEEAKKIGSVRTFRSVRLAAGTSWKDYKVEVVVERNGERVSQERTVSLVAGETHSLSFDFDAQSSEKIASR